MTDEEKANRMHNAIVALGREYREEGRIGEALAVFVSLVELQKAPASLVRLYTILTKA